MFDDRKNVRPLLFKNDNDDYPYSLGGTCFLFLYENKPYIITAKHCLKNRDIASLTVLIDPWKQTGDIYPFSFTSPFHILPAGVDENADDDYLDVIYYPVDVREYTPETADFFYAFQRVFAEDFSLDKRKICVVGYPNPVHEIDYDKKVYDSSFASFSVTQIVKEDDFKYSVVLAENPLDDYNGFSGSPVYSVGDNGNVKIIGMVLRGGAENRILHFLDIQIIRAAIHGVQQGGLSKS